MSASHLYAAEKLHDAKLLKLIIQHYKYRGQYDIQGNNRRRQKAAYRTKHQRLLYLCIGAKVMLSENISATLGSDERHHGDHRGDICQIGEHHRY